MPSNHLGQFVVTVCRGCGTNGLKPGRVWRDLPVCSQFADEAPDRFTLGLARCKGCGLVQLSQGPLAQVVTPRLSWISYREPEAHLDVVRDALFARQDLPIRTVLGVGPFDRPLLDRLEASGASVEQLDLVGSMADPQQRLYPYLETLQGEVRTREPPSALTEASADVVVFRYVIEHCDDPRDALLSLRERLRPDGRLVIEAPDSTKFLQRCDYSFLWEEHRIYLTPLTFSNLIESCGLRLLSLCTFPGELEDAMVAICSTHDLPSERLQGEGALESAAAADFDRYCDEFPRVKESWTGVVRDSSRRGAVALLGAGHQSITFANIMGLTTDIEFVIDDDPLKQGCVAPGFANRIAASFPVLSRTDVGLCLVGLRPSIITDLEVRFPDFIARGGRFVPIAHPPSPLASGEGAS